MAEIRHYRCTVDLRSIREVPRTASVFARYQHVLFGAAPFITRPTVAISPGQERPFANGFCLYEFSTTALRLAEVLTDTSLEITVWHKDPAMRDE